MSDPVAKAHIELEAKIDGLEAALATAIAEMKAVGEVSEATTRKISGLYDDLELYFEVVRFNANKAENQAKSLGATLDRIGSGGAKVASIFSKITVPIAAILGMARLANFIQKARYEAEEFDKALGKITKGSGQELAKMLQQAAGVDEAEQQVVEVRRKVAQEVDEIAKQLEEKLSRWGQTAKDKSLLWSAIVGTNSDSFREQAAKQIEAAEQQAENLIDSIRKRASKKRVEEAAAQAKQEADARRDVLLSSAEMLSGQERAIRERVYLESLDEEKRITAEAMLEISRLRREAYIEGTGVDLSGIIDAINAEKDARIKAYREQKAEEERIDKEKNARVAKDAADKMEREMTRAFEAAAASLDQRLGTLAGFGGFQNVAEAMRDIANAVDRRRGL